MGINKKFADIINKKNRQILLIPIIPINPH